MKKLKNCYKGYNYCNLIDSQELQVICQKRRIHVFIITFPKFITFNQTIDVPKVYKCIVGWS